MYMYICKSGERINEDAYDFDLKRPEQDLSVQILHVESYFEQYANIICMIRQCINRTTFEWIKANKDYRIPKNCSLVLTDGEISGMVDISKKIHLGLDGGSDLVDEFIRDFVAVRVDRFKKIYSPFRLTSRSNGSKKQQRVPTFQYDLSSYWDFIKDPNFRVLNDNSFYLYGHYYDLAGFYQHPEFNRLIIDLCLRLYAHEPIIFLMPDITEPEVNGIVNTLPRDTLGNRFIGFVTE